ncbi:Outer membrane protein OprM [Halomonadaceae bacterium LMG 33818]|uniref:efflux transporter outer membrane subunit n=1 Tax=Cernens ardua TaxID=3402176 RepID=UPI003EDC9BF3
MIKAGMRRVGTMGALSLLLSACHPVGPDYVLPHNADYNKSSANGDFHHVHNPAIAADKPLPSQWWMLYHDATLNDLIESALEANTDLRIALANLKSSQAVYDQALSAGGFSMGATAGADRAARSGQAFLQDARIPPANVASLVGNVSYDFDFFGKISRGVEAARDNTQAVQAALDMARVNVVGEVTGSYMNICNANNQLAVMRETLAIQQRSLNVAQRLVAAGRGTVTDVAGQQALVDQVQASIPPLEISKQTAINQLSTLLGRTPGDISAKVVACQRPPQLTQPLPIGNGRMLLARRPDIRQAERQLASDTALVGVATADLYPQISFGTSGGYVGRISSFTHSPTRQWSFGPLISWQVPTSGAYARVREMRANAQGAFARFDKTVLSALQEVQTSLDQYAEDLDRLQSLEGARDQAQLASTQNQRRYQLGRVPYISSLDAQRVLVHARNAVAAQEAQVTNDQIQLFMALGGGWQHSAIRGNSPQNHNGNKDQPNTAHASRGIATSHGDAHGNDSIIDEG